MCSQVCDEKIFFHSAKFFIKNLFLLMEIFLLMKIYFVWMRTVGREKVGQKKGQKRGHFGG